MSHCLREWISVSGYPGPIYEDQQLGLYRYLSRRKRPSIKVLSPSFVGQTCPRTLAYDAESCCGGKLAFAGSSRQASGGIANDCLRPSTVGSLSLRSARL